MILLLRKAIKPLTLYCENREVVERGIPELLASAAAGAGGSGGGPGASLGEQLSALQPAAFRCLLAAARAATRACLRHSCMCAPPDLHRTVLSLSIFRLRSYIFTVSNRHCHTLALLHKGTCRQW